MLTRINVRASFSVLAMCALGLGVQNHAYAAGFDSGSTGADGAFSPATNVTLTPPESGIYNFTTINIPAGVTVKFARNTTNTPVMLLATGNVSIAGAIDVSGSNAGTYGKGLSAPSQGAIGGPGGFDGGRGGTPGGGHGAPGQGIGGGGGGNGPAGAWCDGNIPEGGGGAGFGTPGEHSNCLRSSQNGARHGTLGSDYGTINMLPVVGGSGGGGGGGPINGGWQSSGGAGGGGGGALLLASNGTITIVGKLLARGGNGGYPDGGCASYDVYDEGASGGGGSGGMVRVMAPITSIATNAIEVWGGAGGCRSYNYWGGGNAASGRQSIENPQGGALSFNALPAVAITQIGGVNVPAVPTGTGDVNLPLGQGNPITVAIAARNIPLSSTVKLLMVPTYGSATVTANAVALTGTLENSTTTASIALPAGPSVLAAHVSYNLSLAMGQALSVYAMGEQVERVELVASVGQAAQATLITVTGKQYKVPPSVLALLSAA